MGQLCPQNRGRGKGNPEDNPGIALGMVLERQRYQG
jgi:hypothetical protein